VTDQLSNEELDRRVLFELGFHHGEENAVNRWELVEKVFHVQVPEDERNDDNLLDRDIRYAVSRLRKRGELIGDLGNGAGRYMIRTEGEFWKWYGYYVKPMAERRQIAEAMKDAAKEKFPSLLQPSLFGAEVM
jgi:hypothetical protein